jgi:hypothetical protein
MQISSRQGNKFRANKSSTQYKTGSNKIRLFFKLYIHSLTRMQNEVIFRELINYLKTQGEQIKYLKIPVKNHYINEEFKG